MGVACPQVSDDTSYTMVESSVGGSCRCACQEDFSPEEDPSTASCCSPQVFTSVLLGILACVLMTGGVFLAFHRWDPLWLIVSGIGIILILIGSILHCCSGSDSSRTRSLQSSSGKGGCCGRPVQADHHLHSHLVANNGSLTEQLLPLSNARSVSQLSLNMLPGYFPPVVTTYGIEQHSAVVQNINRIVQQQQQAQNPGSASPGVQSGAGKSFILLSLPGDTTQANLQNLVATVYQLDGNSAMETPATEATSIPSSVATAIPVTPAPLTFKNAEVQTCSIWSKTVQNSSSTAIADVLQNSASTSTSTEHSNIEPQRPSTSTASGMTQTEDTNPVSEVINLMDCSSDIPPICDNVQSTCSNQTVESSALVNIPTTSSSVLVDVSEPSTETVPLESSLAIPESSNDNLLDLPTPTTDVLVEVGAGTASCSVDIPGTSFDVLIDIGDSTTDQASNLGVPQSSETITNIVPMTDLVADELLNSTENTNSLQTEATLNPVDTSNQLQVDVNAELSLSCSNLSDIDGEVDDSELLERSSPPPSYDDATHEGENAIGAFGLAYGTI